MRRVLCVAFAWMLVLMLMPLGTVVRAEDENFPGMAECTFQPGEIYTWSYTPGSDGEYILHSYNGYPLVVELTGQSPLSYSEGIDLNTYTVYRLSSGITYQIRAYLASGYEQPYMAAFSLFKKEPLQSLTVSASKLTPARGDYVSLYAEVFPAYYDSSTVQWSTSDSSIAAIDRVERHECFFRATDYGTATITASLSGMTASCEVEVVKPVGEWNSYEEWPAGQTSMTVRVSGSRQFRYSPTTTGWYLSDVTTGGSMEVQQTNWAVPFYQKTAVVDNRTCRLYYLEGGETYVITVIGDGSQKAVLEPARQAIRIDLYGPNMTDGTRIVGSAGGRMSLCAETDPAYAYALDDKGFVFTSSNPSVARVETSGNTGDPGCEVVLVGPGSCTITVSVAGVSAVCNVTVDSPYVFRLGETVTLRLSGEVYGVTGTFTPEKSGYYMFIMKGTGGTAYIEDTEIGTYVNGSGTMGGWLEGGRSYTVHMAFGGSNHTVTVVASSREEIEENKNNQTPEQGDGPDQPGQESTVPKENETQNPTETGGQETGTAQDAIDVQTQEPIPEELKDLVEELGADYRDGVVVLENRDVLPAELLDALSGAGKGLELRSEGGTVRLDAAAVTAVNGQAGGDVTLELSELDQSKLKKPQQEALKDCQVAGIITLSLHSGDKYIHDFEDGTVWVTLPFRQETGKADGDYVVYYLSDNGEMERMETSYGDGTLTFCTGHFSEYVVLYEEKNNGWLFPVLCAAAATLVLGALAFAILRKRRQSR